MSNAKLQKTPQNIEGEKAIVLQIVELANQIYDLTILNQYPFNVAGRTCVFLDKVQKQARLVIERSEELLEADLQTTKKLLSVDLSKEMKLLKEESEVLKKLST